MTRKINHLDAFVLFLMVICLIVGFIGGYYLGYYRGTQVVKSLAEDNAVQMRLVESMIPDFNEDLKRLEKLLLEIEREYEIIYLQNEILKVEK